MNLQKFDELMESQPCQDKLEWMYFLEFIDGYFKNRGITDPIVVEIGVWGNVQKRFYQELLNAEHIGIDIEKQTDIIGDSHVIETVEKLKVKLAGRMIDLLFIDGAHDYNSVKCDYELYGPLTKYIIVFHDIFLLHGLSEVHRFWQDILRTEKEHTLIAFKKYISPPLKAQVGSYQLGIGLVIKNQDLLNNSGPNI